MNLLFPFFKCCIGTFTTPKIMLCILMLGLLLAMLSLKLSREKELPARPNLTLFYKKCLKSTGAKVLSASVPISDNTVRTPCCSNETPCFSGLSVGSNQRPAAHECSFGKVFETVASLQTNKDFHYQILLRVGTL